MATSVMHAPAATNARRRTGGGRILLVVVAGVILVFLGLPTLIVVPVSLSPTEYLDFPPKSLTLHWYYEFFTDPKWIAATLLSLRIGLTVTVVAAVVGTMAALGIVRGLRGGGAWINGLVTAPLIVPTIVYAIAILLFFSKLRLAGSFAGFVIAHSALATPYVVLIVSAALYRFDASMELAALSLGASRLQAIWHVTLPSICPALATGAVFAFLTSFDDATVSFFLANLTEVTLPRKMFENLQFFISPVLAVVATLLTALVLALVGGAQWLRLRRKDAAEAET
jgi:mannopine transport system permease protein